MKNISKSKKIIILSCMLVIFTAFVLVKMPVIFAQGADAKTYSLDDANARVLSSSTSLRLLGEKISLAEKRRDAEADSIEKDKKTKALEDLREQLYQGQNAMEIEVARLYYQILIKDQAINVQQNRIQRLNKELQSKQKQVELGNYTEDQTQMVAGADGSQRADSSLIDCKTAIADAQAKLSSHKNEREKLVMSLNVYMGNDVDTQIILKAKDIPDAVLSIGNLAQLAEDLSLEAYSITSRMKLQDIDQRLMSNYKSTTQTVAILAKEASLDDELLKLKYEIEDEQDNIETKVRTDYNDVLSAKDAVNVKRMDSEKYDRLAKIAKLRYDLGLIVYTEYSKAQEDADDALWAYQQAKLDYYVKVEQYKNYIKPAN